MRSNTALEKTIEQAACKKLRERGALVFKLNFRAQRSAPDRLILAPNGVTLFIEFKRIGAVATKLQEHMHKQIKSRGHNVAVCRSVKEAIEFYERCIDARTSILRALNYDILATSARISNKRHPSAHSKR